MFVDLCVHVKLKDNRFGGKSRSQESALLQNMYIHSNPQNPKTDYTGVRLRRFTSVMRKHQISTSICEVTLLTQCDSKRTDSGFGTGKYWDFETQIPPSLLAPFFISFFSLVLNRCPSQKARFVSLFTE